MKHSEAGKGSAPKKTADQEAYKFNDFDRHGLFRTDAATGTTIFYTISVL